jgi:hypothetical protein
MASVAQLNSSLDFLTDSGCLEEVDQSTQIKENWNPRVVY